MVSKIEKEENSKIVNIISKFGPLLGLAILFVSLSILSPYFLTMGNLFNVMRQSSIKAILAIGLTYVIITGGIDLSVGSIVAFSGVMGAAFAVDFGWGVIPGIIMGILFGTLCGAIDGFLVSRIKLPAFIATLGMMSIARAGAYVYTKGIPISGLPESLRFLGKGYIFKIPVPVLIVAVLAIIGHYILNHTQFGRYVYAIGGNEEACRLSGVNVTRVKFMVFSISGFLAGIGGIILAGRLNSAQPMAGMTYELDAIAATVMGGTSLAGGKGSVSGAMIGALIMGVIRNGLNLLNISPFWQKGVIGVVIILAVIVDRMRQS